MATTALSKSFPDPFRHSLRTVLGYAAAVLSVSAALIVTLGLGSAVKHTPTILFFCAITVSSWFGGLWPGILAGLLSTLALDYYFIPPIYSFVASSEYVLSVLRDGEYVGELKRAERDPRYRSTAFSGNAVAAVRPLTPKRAVSPAEVFNSFGW